MIDIIKNKFDKSFQITKKYFEILDSIFSGNIDKNMFRKKAEEISKLRAEEKKDYDSLNQVQTSYYFDIINNCQLSFDLPADFNAAIGRIYKKLNAQMLKFENEEKFIEYSLSFIIAGDIKTESIRKIDALLNKMLQEENTFAEKEMIKSLLICNLQFLVTVGMLNDYLEEFLINKGFDYSKILEDDTISAAFNKSVIDADKNLLDNIIMDYINVIKLNAIIDEDSDIFGLLTSKTIIQLLIPYMGQEHLVKYKKEIEGIRVTNDNSQAIYALSDTIKKRIKKIQDTN